MKTSTLRSSARVSSGLCWADLTVATCNKQRTAELFHHLLILDWGTQAHDITRCPLSNIHFSSVMKNKQNCFDFDWTFCIHIGSHHLLKRLIEKISFQGLVCIVKISCTVNLTRKQMLIAKNNIMYQSITALHDQVGISCKRKVGDPG